jgi:predicted DsbA family dithiol-disulfide isomerase
MLAHEATVYAKERGLDAEFHHAAARAYWETGADLGDIEVIRRLAVESGLDWAELSSRLESGFYRGRVLQEYEDAKLRGVSGTPTYWTGGELLRGDVSLDDLRAALQKAAAG